MDCLFTNVKSYSTDGIHYTIYNDPKQVVKLGLQGEKKFCCNLQNLLMPANLGRVLSHLCPHVLKIYTEEYKI